jgi:hypothetical protein
VTAASLSSGDNCPVGGFIVLEDGRAYAAANWATDATLRAISREASDTALRGWLLAQQSEHVGMGMTSVDLREIAPRYRPVLRAAIRRAYERVINGDKFENQDLIVDHPGGLYGDPFSRPNRFSARDRFSAWLRHALVSRRSFPVGVAGSSDGPVGPDQGVIRSSSGVLECPVSVKEQGPPQSLCDGQRCSVGCAVHGRIRQ